MNALAIPGQHGLEQLLRFGAPQVVELGKIKIGMKEEQARKSRSGGEWRSPKKLDYFVITTLNRDANTNLIPNVRLMESLREYADTDSKLRQLPVTFLSNNITDILETKYVSYIGSNRAAESDGVTLIKYYDSAKKAWLQTPEAKPWKPEYAEMKDSKGVLLFKQHTTLNVAIRSPEAGWNGYYKYRTTSIISFRQILGSLLQTASMTCGVLIGVPMRMVVRPIVVAPDGKKSTAYVVHLELVGSDLMAIKRQATDMVLEDIRAANVIRDARSQRKVVMAIGGIDDNDEDAEIAAEFHPEGFAEGEVPNEPTPSGTDPLMAKIGVETPPATEAVPAPAVHNDDPPAAGPDDDGDPDDWDDEPPPTLGSLFSGGNGANEKRDLDATK